jgi:hypothetical protein
MKPKEKKGGPPKPAREIDDIICELLAACQEDKKARCFSVWVKEGKRLLELYRRTGKREHLDAFNRLSEGAHDWLVGEVMRNE